MVKEADMTKETSSKNLDVFSKVIVALAKDAAADVDGITLPDSKRSKSAVSVYFLPNDKVTVDMFVNISSKCTVPTAVASLQENVKCQIESATKYKVHSVNVQVMNVDIEQ